MFVAGVSGKAGYQRDYSVLSYGHGSGWGFQTLLEKRTLMILHNGSLRPVFSSSSIDS